MSQSQRVKTESYGQPSRLLKKHPSDLIAVFFLAVLAALVLLDLLEGDYASLAIVCLMPALPYVLRGSLLMLRTPVVPLLAIAVIFIESSNFRIRDVADKSVDFQIALRLSGVALMYLFGGLVLQKQYKKGFDVATLTWICFLSYLSCTSIYAVTPMMAFIAAASNLGGFGFILFIFDRLGRRTFINIVVSSCLILCSLSIVIYYLDPSLGRMSDWDAGAFLPTGRLQGLFGTANAAGLGGAFGLMLLVLFSGIKRTSALFVLMCAVFGFCMLKSDNRMAIGAVAGCLAYISLSNGNRGLKTVIGGLALALVTLLFYAFGDVLLDHIARSGSGDEVLSGTGRTRIWAVVIDLWSEHPIFGLGFTSSGQILPKNEMLFAAAAHAHDVYLEMLFSGGVIGLGLYLAAWGTSVRQAYAYGRHKEIGVIVFFLIYGITEPLMNGMVGFSSLAMFVTGVLAFSPRQALPKRSVAGAGSLPKPIRA